METDWLSKIKHELHKITCIGPCCGKPRRKDKGDWIAEVFYPDRKAENDQQHGNRKSDSSNHQ
jgi:hypothetical protein